MSKTITAAQAAGYVKDGMTVMIGGFMVNGTPEVICNAIAAQGTKNLTVIANDGGFPGRGVGALISAGCVKKLIVSHIGLNPDAGAGMKDGSIDVTLVPQGTLAECIRAGGAGLGGVLTPTGLGTDVAIGKEVVTIDGKEFLLEKALKADVALIGASRIDEDGSIFYAGTTRNFNPMMATAAEVVIAGAPAIEPIGAIKGEEIVTPGIFVDYIVVGGEA